MRNQKLALVEEHRLIPIRKFESITIGEILDFWWERHGKHRNSKFEYLLFRLDRFKPMKARNLTPEMVQDFLGAASAVASVFAALRSHGSHGVLERDLRRGHLPE